MLWHIELKFCIWLCFTVLQIKFECRQFASIFVGVMPLFELRILEIHSFPHFSLTPFNILSWKFAYYFVFLYYRSSLSVVSRLLVQHPCQVPFKSMQGCRRSWEDKLKCVKILSVKDHYSAKICRTWIISPHSALFSYMLWHIELKFCIWLCFTVLQIKFECCQFASIFVGVMPLFELRILEIHSFPHFSLTPFNILSWKFAYYFVFLYYRSSLSVVNLRLFWSYASFRT